MLSLSLFGLSVLAMLFCESMLFPAAQCSSQCKNSSKAPHSEHRHRIHMLKIVWPVLHSCSVLYFQENTRNF